MILFLKNALSGLKNGWPVLFIPLLLFHLSFFFTNNLLNYLLFVHSYWASYIKLLSDCGRRLGQSSQLSNLGEREWVQSTILQVCAWLPSLSIGVRLRVTMLWYKSCCFSNVNCFVFKLTRYWSLSQQGHLQPHFKSKAWQLNTEL